MVTINGNKVSAGVAIFVIIFVFPLFCSYVQAQTSIAFSPAEQFSVPAYNGSISFAVNGTYSKATFENNTWTFSNLLLDRSQPLENFHISTQNSNITISSYATFNNTVVNSIRLRYAVEGQGKQILNLNLGAEPNPSVEWSVTVNNNVSLAEGKSWSISHDGTMTVNGASGNVSIVRFDFSALFGNSESNSNLPFYQQHSVAILIAAAFALVVVVAVLIKVKNRKQTSESD
ncbi:MAG: hypothetical protein ABSD92_14400 [Candidatus Bathyarchaeia archaeon]